MLHVRRTFRTETARIAVRPGRSDSERSFAQRSSDVQ
jgi:hypothetical protein